MRFAQGNMFAAIAFLASSGNTLLPLVNGDEQISRAADVVKELNDAFNGDPLDIGSAPGVVMHGQSNRKFGEVFCGTTCSNSSIHSDSGEYATTWSTCRTSASIIHSAYSILRYPFSQCTQYQEYYDTDFVPSFYEFGWVYQNDVLDMALRCAYPSDAGTRFRVNYGCGCDFTFICDALNVTEPCPNACRNIDPQNGQTPTSTESLTVEYCHGTDASANYDPNTPPFWKGPAFAPNAPNEIRKMIQQRLNFPDLTQTCTEDEYGFHPNGLWNELAFDSALLDKLQRQKFTSIIKTFYITDPCKTEEDVLNDFESTDYLKDYVTDYRKEVVIVGYNNTNVKEPFFELVGGCNGGGGTTEEPAMTPMRLRASSS